MQAYPSRTFEPQGDAFGRRAGFSPRFVETFKILRDWVPSRPWTCFFLPITCHVHPCPPPYANGIQGAALSARDCCQFRWTRQLPPAARRLEHTLWALSRVFVPMRTRYHEAPFPRFWITSGS